MNDAIIIQHAYPKRGFEPMLELTRKHHEEYCELYKMDFRSIAEDVSEHDFFLGAFAKIVLIKEALEKGYQYVIWIDADAMIADFSVDLRKAFEENTIGVCWQRIPQLNHWNTGVLYVSNAPEVREFVDKWLSVYPPPKDGWNEQGVFNRMGRESRIVSTISDKWNATIGVSMVPDAVVIGFHGQGNAEYRYNEMKITLDRIANKKAARTQA